LQEWQSQLRSSLHPLLFAAVYRFADAAARFSSLSTTSRTALLLAAPKVLQAVFAACTDFFTWRLAERLYGHEHEIPRITVSLIPPRLFDTTLSHVS
jgi:GPI mannosyltransferase 3